MIPIKYIVITLLICGIGGLIIYSITGHIFDHPGSATGSSGASYGIFSAAILSHIRNLNFKNFAIYGSIPISILAFEILRAMDIIDSSMFVAGSPFANAAHIAGIIIGSSAILTYVALNQNNTSHRSLNSSSVGEFKYN